MSDSTSVDAIVEGLKQGNALELEFIKQLKDGLNFLADGMEKECLNRSDALSAVREKLETGRAAGRGHVTAEQKATLTSIIKATITNGESSIWDSRTAFFDARSELAVVRDSALEDHEQAMNEAKEEKTRLERLGSTIVGMHNVEAYTQLRDVLGDWGKRQERLREEKKRINDEYQHKRRAAYLKFKELRTKIEDQIYVLRDIAVAAGIKEGEIG